MNIKKTNINDITKNVTFETLEIDGIAIGGVCFSSKEDKEKAEKIIQQIVDSTDKTGYALANYVRRKLEEFCRGNENKEENEDEEYYGD